MTLALDPGGQGPSSPQTVGHGRRPPHCHRLTQHLKGQGKELDLDLALSTLRASARPATLLNALHAYFIESSQQLTGPTLQGKQLRVRKIK